MLYLASQSPRRRVLLQQLGITFKVIEIAVPEQPGPDEVPADYVERVARDKGRAALAKLESEPATMVLSADTEVVLGGEALGKPRDADAVRSMLSRLGGREHEVVSVVWLATQERAECARCVSRVRMTPLDDAEMAAYIATGEPFDKAGGYAIQGRAAAFIAHLSGSYSAVMGLPLYETAGLLRDFGMR